MTTHSNRTGSCSVTDRSAKPTLKTGTQVSGFLGLGVIVRLASLATSPNAFRARTTYTPWASRVTSRIVSVMFPSASSSVCNHNFCLKKINWDFFVT